MIDDEKIIELFFERSEQGIRELDMKYGKICHNLSYNIVNSRRDAEECVNDAYLGAWNAIPPVHPNPLLSYIVKIVRNISLKIYRLNIVPILSFALFIVERRSLLNNIAPIFIPKRVDIFTFFLHSFLKISKYYIFGSRFFTFIA